MAAGHVSCAAPGAPFNGLLAENGVAADPINSWDYGAIDLPRLTERACFYMQQAGASSDVAGTVKELLQSPLGQRLLNYDDRQLFELPLNDAYKPKMHNLYSSLYSAVEADFILNIRKTPFPLQRIFSEDHALAVEYERCADALKDVLPITPEIKAILRSHYSFNTTPAMEEDARRFKVAPVERHSLDESHTVTSAHGPLEAASNAETSLTQIVQQFTIRAQAREIERRTGVHLDRTERLANCLGHLAGVLTKLCVIRDTDMKLALFAGRRSTDRTFLLVQNVLCARCLPNYGGTSSVYAVTLIDRSLRAEGCTDLPSRLACTGRLVGTHAHELMMVTAQLLAAYDDKAGGQGGPVAMSALLSHLLFLRANGSLDAATALPDTFGTLAFVGAALAADVPAEFVEDMARSHPGGPPIPAGAKVFDLIRMWRLDSGSYEDMAEAVVDAWERRRADAPHPAPPRPGLMHSNLSSVEEVLEASRLPERIRPTICAFGGLADGFLPFQLPGGGTADVKLASIVMKAAQARLMGGSPYAAAAADSRMESAGKIGDDVSMSKAQVDVRLPHDAQERVKERMAHMLHRRQFDAQLLSQTLAAAYHDVTRKRILCVMDQ